MKILATYATSIILFIAICLGSLVGYSLPKQALNLQWLSQIFLNFILTAVTPLVFFSVALATKKMIASQMTSRLISTFSFSFILFSSLPAIFMLLILQIIHPSVSDLAHPVLSSPFINIGEQIIKLVSVADFPQLFNHQHLLPLILFAGLIGCCLNETLVPFFEAANELFTSILKIIMYFAPVGFFAFFAVLTAQLGPKIINNYFSLILVYYSAGIVYVFICLSFVIYFIGNATLLKHFWKQMPIPLMTALATCSSAASIPVSLEANKKLGVAAYINESVIPLATFLLKQGTVLGAMVKIYFLFAIYHITFAEPLTFLKAIGVSMLAGPIMGAVPGGGMLGELLIITIYQFPIEILPFIAAIGMVIDPLATMINVAGNNACVLFVARLANRLPQLNLGEDTI